MAYIRVMVSVLIKQVCSPIKTQSENTLESYNTPTEGWLSTQDHSRNVK